MARADDHVEDTGSLSRTLAKYYFVGISWSLASSAVLAGDLGLPSIVLSDSFTLHIDHVVIVGAVFVAIVFPAIFALIEVASAGR